VATRSVRLDEARAAGGGPRNQASQKQHPEIRTQSRASPAQTQENHNRAFWHQPAGAAQVATRSVRLDEARAAGGGPRNQANQKLPQKCVPKAEPAPRRHKITTIAPSGTNRQVLRKWRHGQYGSTKRGQQAGGGPRTRRTKSCPRNACPKQSQPRADTR